MRPVAPHHDPKCKIGQHFVWGHGGAVRGMIIAQAPYEAGGEPTMRKGSYSEELVRNKLEELVAGTPVQEICNLLQSSVVRPRVVIVGAPMRTPPGESAETSPRTVL